LPPELDPAQAHWAAGEAREALNGLWRTLDARWVNPPLAEAAAVSKPEQLQRARLHGLAVPETLVTNDGAEAQEFASAGQTICKPMGRGAITVDGAERLFFTRLLNDDDVAALATIGPEPYLLQRLIPKQYDLRVTIIGEELFAVRIDSQVDSESSVDWRRGDANELNHEAIDLPRDVAERCLALIKSYGLVFAAVDFAVDPEGRHVFFEINPSGQWAWLEERAGVPLRGRLAALLAGQ
jgi:glutathione synthase/RimK-type ligase-like ATP-grasp enzyme